MKPPALKEGDTVGIVAPASRPYNPSSVKLAAALLEHLGFKVILGNHLLKKYGYMAGRDEERVEDLHALWSNDQVRAIFALHGGYGSLRLLPYLDYELLKEHPKIFVGSDDITSLLLVITDQIGLVTYHGPCLTAIGSDEYTINMLKKVLTSTEPLGEVDLPKGESSLDLHPLTIFSIKDGVAKGKLMGGNLTALSALLGTPYEIDFKGKILFFEETDEGPGTVDRHLTSLWLSGKLQEVAGVVVGECEDTGATRSYFDTIPLEELLMKRLGVLDLPSMYGLPIGQKKYKATLPLGIQATLDTKRCKLIIEEGAVE
ncbi:MAG: LD-carboxypeptidase [Candidatus Tectomicrobia bacterium]|nr:LD-carboxypeptidase [Candidatus Tectomicrobia bacterium]